MLTEEIDTVVFARVCRRAGTLYSQTYITGNEIVFLTIGRIKVYIDRNLEFLVIRLVNKVNIADNTHTAFTLRAEFVDVHRVLVVENVVFLEQYNHFVGCRAVNHIIRQHFIIRESAVVYAHVTEFHVCRVRTYGNFSRVHLHERGRGLVL